MGPSSDIDTGINEDKIHSLIIPIDIEAAKDILTYNEWVALNNMIDKIRDKQ